MIPERVVSVIRTVAAQHGVPASSIIERQDAATKANKPIADARKCAMRAVRRMKWGSGCPSYPQMGVWFRRDHTTVIWACREES